MMFINPELARERLNDPGNIVNKLLEIGLGSPKPKRDETPASIAEEGSAEVDINSDIKEAAGNESRPLIKLGRNRTSPSVETGISTVVKRNRHGRTNGAIELDAMTKEIAGTLTRMEGPASVARAFEIAPSTAFHLGRADGKKDGDEIRGKIEKNLGRVRDVAIDRLLASVNLLDDDKLEGLGAKDLSSVASNLSRVVEKTLPKEMQQGPTAQLIVYAPTIAKEEHYETVVLQG